MSKSTTVALKNIMVLTKNVEKSSQFYSDALGLKLIHQTSTFAELRDKNKVKLVLKQVDQEAYTKVGYSPILNYEVEDLDSVLESCKQHGAELDGDIIEDEIYRVACLKNPEG